MDIAILQALEKIRCPFLDVFFAIFTTIGEEAVVAAIVAVVFICFNKRIGEQALLSVLSASCVTAGLKSAVRRNRPYVAGAVEKVEIDNPIVSTADLTGDVSFPSGHSTAASSFFGTLAIRIRKPLVIVLCCILTLLVMLSRLYLGVHYPSDVLTGFAIGTAFAFFWALVYKKWYAARLYIFLGISLLTLPLLFIPRTATESMFQISALSIAVALSLLAEEKFLSFEDTKIWWKRIARLAIIGVAALIPFLPMHFLLPNGNWFDFLKYFVTLAFAMPLSFYLYRKLKI